MRQAFVYLSACTAAAIWIIVAVPARAGDTPAADDGSGASRAAGPAAPTAVDASDPTLYFARDQVAAAFAKSPMLYDGHGLNFQVLAIRRDKPGQAEVHALYADVIYVVEGSARLVTGGKVVDGKETEPGETRGARIDGGTTRAIAKGDVVVVPNGTPHWVESVEPAVSYFVVKVR
jgi:mannose-6-phosphate isomerase-like protein (cupin superfamily)